MLDDEGAKAHAIRFLDEIVHNESVQKSAGDGIWAAVKYAVVPWGGKEPSIASKENSIVDREIISVSPEGEINIKMEHIAADEAPAEKADNTIDAP